jgi:hypothetical protein
MERDIMKERIEVVRAISQARADSLTQEEWHRYDRLYTTACDILEVPRDD